MQQLKACLVHGQTFLALFNRKEPKELFVFYSKSPPPSAGTLYWYIQRTFKEALLRRAVEEPKLSPKKHTHDQTPHLTPNSREGALWNTLTHPLIDIPLSSHHTKVRARDKNDAA